jgi:hypothetical protein
MPDRASRKSLTKAGFTSALRDQKKNLGLSFEALSE